MARAGHHHRMTDPGTEIMALSRSASALESVCDQLHGAISMLEQPPPPTLWWGSARREYETAAGELVRVMQQLRDDLISEAAAHSSTASMLAFTAAGATASGAGLW